MAPAPLVVAVVEAGAVDGSIYGYKKHPSKISGCFLMDRTLLLFGLLFWEDIYERARNNLACEILDLFGLEFYET